MDGACETLDLILNKQRHLDMFVLVKLKKLLLYHLKIVRVELVYK